MSKATNGSQTGNQGWATDDEPLTGAPKLYFQTMAREFGEENIPDNLTQRQVSEKIEQFRQRNTRSQGKA